MVQTLHTCADESSFSVQAICEDGTLGASDVFVIVAGTLVLAGIGVAIWFWMKRRFGE